MSSAVRPATADDVPALRRMKTSLLALEGSLHVATASEADWRRDLFAPDARFSALVAEAGGKAVGMVTYEKRGFPGWSGCAFFMHDLYVDEAYRGRGLARTLMVRLAAEAETHKAAFIELTVDAANGAREFYARMGFAHVRHCMTYIAAQPALRDLTASAAPESEPAEA